MYSLTPRSPDEAIARDVLLGRRIGHAPPEGIVNVVDASNLERNLYLTSQLLELRTPLMVVLTMTDVAAEAGAYSGRAELAERLGVPVTSVVVRTKKGLNELLGSLAISRSADQLARSPISCRR